MSENKVGTSSRIENIVKLATGHFGPDIQFVGVKYAPSIGWVAKIKLFNSPSFSESDLDSSEKALRKLEKRILKIIDRYAMV